MPGRILVADDARFMRQVMREILEPEGFEVVGEAIDGRNAVAQYARLRPDVVAVDVVMPERSATSVAQDILAIDSGARILMMAAVGQEVLLEEALAAGATAAVAKPFKPFVVLATLRTLMARDGEPFS